MSCLDSSSSLMNFTPIPAGLSGPAPAGSRLEARANLPETDLVLLSRVREAAEQAKIALSTETEVEISLPFLAPDFNFSCRFTRDELEHLTRDIIARTRVHCLRSLADAKLELGLFVELPILLVLDGHDFERERPAIAVAADVIDRAVRAFAQFRKNLE